MASRLTIHLVRHGQSEANLDKTLNATVADHAVALSPEGRTQAAGVGEYLAHRLDDAAVEWTSRVPDGATGEKDPPSKVGVYVSPYRRTRETWKEIASAITGFHGRGFTDAMRTVESIHLRELEFGLFDGIPDEELAARFPVENAHYEKHLRHSGEFYARMPSGESRCDVAQRVHTFFGTLHRDAERHGVEHAIVVSHGVTIRAFAMMWLHQTPEWFAQQRNPRNCSVRELSDGEDLGYAFHGFEHARASKQDVREAGEVG